MEGSRRSAVVSLRTRHAKRPTGVSRGLLRHLISSSDLAPGSRVVVGGDGAEEMAEFLVHLGMQGESAGRANLSVSDWDAAFWLDTKPARSGERSLLSASALGLTASLLAALRPGGNCIYIYHRPALRAGHDLACLERHFAVFPGEVQVRAWHDRPRPRLWGTGSRDRGYVLATYERPASDVDRALWRRQAVAAACGLAVPCCRWAGEAVERPIAA